MLPKASMKFSCTASSVENLAYDGFGKIQSIHWARPISELPDCSISDLATAGWLKPPIVKLVDSIEKFASPVTMNQNRTGRNYWILATENLTYMPTQS